MTPPTDASEGRDRPTAASFRVQPANDRVARERTIKSVQHAIDILDLLAGPVRAGGVTGLAAALGMNVSTVHHLLRTLQARGLVEQDPESKLYRLGRRTVQLGDAYLLGLDPTTPARLNVRSPTAVDNAREIGLRKARAKPCYKMVFIQYQPHAVAAAWSHGIQDVAAVQGNVEYQLWDGRASVDRQISLMRSAIKHGVDAIFLQPVDSLAVCPSIKEARAVGIPVITLNIDSTDQHATHVEMDHYQGGLEIGNKLGQLMRGSGNVVILNAPRGVIIREQRTNGFKDGLKNYPGIKIVADESADWDRKKARDVLSAIMGANSDIQGVFGVNDSMALGAVDVLKAKGLIGNVFVFGDDGEKDALDSIAAGELTGTQYTDVHQQGRLAASIAVAKAIGGTTAKHLEGRVLMPYCILTRDNVDQIQPSQRWG